MVYWKVFHIEYSENILPLDTLIEKGAIRKKGKGGVIIFLVEGTNHEYTNKISNSHLTFQVREDCIVLKSTNGSVVDRWWYENVVNLSCSPKTKVLCIWIRSGEETGLQKICTKKVSNAIGKKKTKVINSVVLNILSVLRDHPCSANAKFSEELTSLTPCYA